MEFYREKKINITLETKLNADEVVKRLSEYVAERPKWFKWPLDCKKPYIGEITVNHFSIDSVNDYLKINGRIEDKKEGAVVILAMQENPIPTRSPEYWTGTMISSILGVVASLAFVSGSLIVFFQIHSLNVIFSITALVLLIQCIAIWKTNKKYMGKLMVKVDNNVKFLSDLFS